MEINTKFTDDRILRLLKLETMNLELIIQDFEKGDNSAIMRVSNNLDALLKLINFGIVADSTTILGTGLAADPIKINPTILTSISHNTTSIGTHTLAINSINNTIASIQTNIAPLLTERIFLSDVAITTTATGGTLVNASLSSKGAVSSKTHPVPIVSATVAGLAPASMHLKVNDLQTQIDALGGTGQTIINDTLSNSATQAELSAAWSSVGYTLVEGSVIENQLLQIRWVYRSNKWNGPYSITSVVIATQTVPGSVLSSADEESNYGKIYVELDGSMSLLGYDDIIASLNTTKGSARVWSAAGSVNLPYTAGTNIAVPEYDINLGTLDVYINGIRITQFTKTSTTTISITESIGGSGVVNIVVDYFKE